MRIFIMPITKSFLEGMYWTGNRIKVDALALADVWGKPAYKETNPLEVGMNTDESYCTF